MNDYMTLEQLEKIFANAYGDLPFEEETPFEESTAESLTLTGEHHDSRTVTNCDHSRPYQNR